MKIFNKKIVGNKTYYRIFNIRLLKRVTNEENESFYFLGIKVLKRRIQKNVILEELKNTQNELKTLKSLFLSTLDIENVPKAQGFLRYIQLAMAKILGEIDEICSQHQIQYFMLFGTLLGAVRHKGFIPWDDDLDIIMLRKDFEKFLEIFEEYKKNSSLDYYWWSNTDYNVFKVILKMDGISPLNSPFIDIHVFDVYPSITDKNKKDEIWGKITTLQNNVQLIKITDILAQQEDIKNNLRKIKQYNQTQIIEDKSYENLSDTSIYMGAEFPLPPFYCFNYCDFYPLIQLEFEGKKFNAPKNYDKFLYERYGDYMKPRFDGDFYHFDETNFTYEYVDAIKKYLCS